MEYFWIAIWLYFGYVAAIFLMAASFVVVLFIVGVIASVLHQRKLIRLRKARDKEARAWR